MTGQKLPDSFFARERFFSIKPDQALVMGSRFGFRRYGQSGLEMSELLPHIGECADDIALVRSMHTDQFDHGPAEILFSTGIDTPGRPSAGAWVTYGLGSESQDLPGYVVLVTGRGPVARSLDLGQRLPADRPRRRAVPGARRAGAEPLQPAGITPAMQRLQLDAIRQLNRDTSELTRDPEIQDRIASYELAFRMQAGAPELIDLGGESPRTHAAYGTDRPGESGSFATNCLLARRLVERGVRFVSIFHRRWDHHSEVHKGVEENCRVVDQPIGALAQGPEVAGAAREHPGRLGHGVRPDAGHPEHPAGAEGRPRSPSPGLQRLAGRRRRPGRPGRSARPTSSAGGSSRTRSTCTTSTPRSCTSSAWTTSS